MTTNTGASSVPQDVDGAEEETDHVLDLTGSQLHNLLDVELPEHLLELDLTANRLSELDDRIMKLSQLQKLSLRQNLLNDDAVKPLGQWSSLFGLQELVLRDNKLTKVPLLGGFTSLVVFDISFNELTSTHGMAKITSRLQELYASKNEIVNIDELEHFNQLRILELGSNKIRVMEGLHNLTTLQELWLGRNRIRAIDLCGLNQLEKISLQSNRLLSMLGIQDCARLEELYLSHNSISRMEGMSALINLRILDISSNKISKVEDIDKLTRLEDLWLNDNLIPTLDGIEDAFSGPKCSLTTIYLERNPCAADPGYISKLLAALPNLQQIDSHIL